MRPGYGESVPIGTLPPPVGDDPTCLARVWWLFGGCLARAAPYPFPVRMIPPVFVPPVGCLLVENRVFFCGCKYPSIRDLRRGV